MIVTTRINGNSFVILRVDKGPCQRISSNGTLTGKQATDCYFCTRTKKDQIFFACLFDTTCVAYLFVCVHSSPYSKLSQILFFDGKIGKGKKKKFKTKMPPKSSVTSSSNRNDVVRPPLLKKHCTRDLPLLNSDRGLTKDHDANKSTSSREQLQSLKEAASALAVEVRQQQAGCSALDEVVHQRAVSMLQLLQSQQEDVTAATTVAERSKARWDIEIAGVQSALDSQKAQLCQSTSHYDAQHLQTVLAEEQCEESVRQEEVLRGQLSAVERQIQVAQRSQESITNEITRIEVSTKEIEVMKLAQLSSIDGLKGRVEAMKKREVEALQNLEERKAVVDQIQRELIEVKRAKGKRNSN